MENDIAIVGFSFQLPNGVDDASSLWNVLSNRKNLTTRWPESRINVGSVSASKQNKVNCRHGHFIDEDPAAFDAPFFSITAKEAASMDPMQRWTLEASYRAFENAGIQVKNLKGSRTAVFSASFSDDYSRMTAQDPEDHHRMAATGTAASLIPNRVSWYFDMRGPSVHVDSACSSSLLAVDMACQSVKSGDASAALVTGSNVILGPAFYSLLAAQGFLSPDGVCYSFDHRANGYARGEGVIALIIKPLSDAVRDGDMIRAVIRGSASNQDGHTPGLTQPSPASQESLIRHVYQKAKLPFKKTRYLEAHGTGTAIGDPIEMEAIGKVFGPYHSTENPLYVGTIKSNVGHLEGSSGLAGVIKSILILEKGCIPPNALFEKLNPKIPADLYHVEVPTTNTPWPCKGLRRVSVNSFGFGGTNTHLIMDDAFHYLQERGIHGNHNTTPSFESQASENGTNGDQNAQGTYGTNGTNDFHGAESFHATNGTNGVHSANDIKGSNGIHSSNGANGTNGANGSHQYNDEAQMPATPASLSQDAPRLLVWTAADEKAVNRVAGRLETYYRTQISGHAEKLDKLAFTLAARRSQMLWRRYALVGPEQTMLLSNLASKATRSLGSPKNGLAFVFTGQGAQYVDMGLGLLQYPVFRNTLEEIDEVYRKLGCKWSLFDELHNKDTIDSPDHSQPLSTALQIALVELLKSFSIVPRAVVGHSSGEIAAAYAIGALSLQSACKVSYCRGQLAGKLEEATASSSQGPGAMMSVNLAEEKINGYFDKIGLPHDVAGEITVACINSPLNCTLSGSEAAIDELKQRLDQDSIFAQKLRTGVAYHSPYMTRISEDYQTQLGSLDGMKDPKATLPILMVSSVTGKPIAPAVLATPQYWVDNMVSPVRFSEALRVLTQETPMLKIDFEEFTDIIEVGPHQALKRPIQDTLQEAAKGGQSSGSQLPRYLPVLHRTRPDMETVMELAGQLFCNGHDVSIPALNLQSSTSTQPFFVDCPEYPFDHTRKYWCESRLSQGFRLREPVAGELLGARSYDWNPLEPRWRNFFSIDTSPWTADHMVSDTVIFPAAGMVLMALEAARQMTPPIRTIVGYYVKEAHFLSPIVIKQNWEDRTETMVHLKPQRKPDMKEPSWMDVTIYSYSATETQWTECFRTNIQVQYQDTFGGPETLSERQLNDEKIHAEYQRAKAACARPIDSQVLYDTAAEHGITWGDWFQTLGDIGWDGISSTVACVDLAKSQRHQTTSLVHPAILDAAIQTLHISTTHGLAMSASNTHIPVKIVDAWFAPNGWQQPKTQSIRYMATSHTLAGGQKTEGTIRALADNDAVLCSIGKLIMSAVASSNSSDETEGNATQVRKLLHSIEWKPQLSLLEPDQLLRACEGGKITEKDEETVLLHYNKLRFILDESICRALKILSTVEGAAKVPETMNRHIEWMNYHVKMHSIQLKGISDEEMEALLQEIETIHPAWKLHATVVRELMTMLTGQADPLQVIFRSNEADVFYTDMFENVCDHRLRNFLDLASHENPGLRILEVGAGTGGMTGRVLGNLLALEKESGVLKFSQYTYTDVTPAFFERASAKWVAIKDRMVFKALDMRVSPDEQGFDLSGYDLVIAGSVLHACEDLLGTMRNVRKLLRPYGRLMMLEPTAPDDVACNYTFGLVPGWWGNRETEPWRGLSPCIPASRWDVVLKDTGFSGNDMCLRDFENDDCHLCSIIVTTRADIPEVETQEGQPPSTILSPSRLIIVIDEEDNKQKILADLVQQQLASPEHQIQTINLNQVQESDLTSNDIVISLVETSKPLLVTLSASPFQAIQNLVERSSSLLWVTVATSENGHAPEFMAIQGFLRTIRAEEVGKNLVSLAIECHEQDDEAACAKYVAKAFRTAFDKSNSSTPSKEREYIVKNGQFTTGRVVGDVFNNETLQSLVKPRLQTKPWLSGPALKLVPGATKMLDSLHFVEDDVYYGNELGPHEVEVEAKVWALNFRDVLVALGRIDDSGLGVDCAGIVTRVGSRVDTSALKPGDRVCMMSPDCMRAYPRASEKLVLKIPDSMSLEAAASVVAPGVTAYFGLLEIARLRKGEKILIHSAAGATGQMALWIAKMQAAEIFVTTSSEKKKKFLRDTCGIPSDHIFYSRDTSFAQAIKRVTQGRGVDVVLNSLSGDGLTASWECIAPFGRFIELGVADIRSNSMLPMASFANNVSFSALDLRHVALTDRDLTHRLVRDTVGLLAEGKIQHPGPLQMYPVSELESAFRQLQGGKNIGRCMITLDRSDCVPQLLIERRLWSLDQNATYLIAGGTGGLGRAIAKWMADRGAKHLILPSRSGKSSPTVVALISELKGRGVQAIAPECDVSSLESLAAVLEDCARSMPPIKGCINAAMVLQDSIFANMTHDQWDLTIKSKVQTSVNLNRLLPSGMDFFILLSSLVGVMGSIGQSNYAAGCTFQDALARHRVRCGEKGISIDVGWMQNIGIVSEMASYQRTLTSDELQKLDGDELFALLAILCDPSSPFPSENESQVLFGLRTPAEFITRGRPLPERLDRPLFSAFAHVGAKKDNADDAASATVSPADAFRAVPANDVGGRAHIVVDALREKLARAMAIATGDVELSKPLSSYGVDSLMAVELRNWIARDFSAQLAVFDIMGNAPVSRIAELVVSKSTVGK